jgi:hypothetical protein
MSSKSSDEDRAIVLALSGGMLGASVLGVFQLLSIQRFNLALLVTLHAFAVSTPFLGMAFWLRVSQGKGDKPEPWSMTVLEVVGIIAAITGLVGLFWSFSQWTGLTFLAAGAVSFGLVLQTSWASRDSY